uniref:Uncharacterized protein n=1 Tax=Siphoviridae sp. ctgu013 TaxID=2826421 RepID=A0A8S5NIF5_9CAUD|nr:MAG TPA: hypothetical protein [Siphoviridae sp. ctgu013]
MQQLSPVIRRERMSRMPGKNGGGLPKETASHE